MTEYFYHAAQWIDDNLITLIALIELTFVFACILLSYFLAKYLQLQITSMRAKRVLGVWSRLLDFNQLLSIITPLLLIFLWLLQVAFNYLDIPYITLNIVNYLYAAWFAIRFVTRSIDKSLLSKFIALCIWIVTALSVIGLLTPTTKLLSSYRLETSQITISLLTITSGIIAFSALAWVYALLTVILKKYIVSNNSLNSRQKLLFLKISKLVLLISVILLGFRIIGINLTSLAVFSGALGLGIGFGLQKIASNLISGFILLFDQSVKPGDTIAIAGTYGVVSRLDARYVSIVTREGKKHLVPNELMISETVENWSFRDQKIRLRIPIGVSYNSDVHQVRQIILDSVKNASERILDAPAPVCLLKGFGDSSIDFELRVWICDPQNGTGAPTSAILFNIWDQFKKHNISIPFPQRDLRIIHEKNQQNPNAGQQPPFMDS